MAKRLTAKELGLSSEMYKVLVEIQKEMADGQFKYILEYTEQQKRRGKYFNMATWGDYEDCRTAACIGGWIEKKLKREIKEKDDYDNVSYKKGEIDIKTKKAENALNKLFFPETSTQAHQWIDITPQEAAQAIHNYLYYGNPRWKEIVKEENVDV